MNYQKLIILLHRGSVNHIARLEKNNNFKNRLLKEVADMRDALLRLEVKRLVLFTNKAETEKKVSAFFDHLKSNRVYTFGASNNSKKISDAMMVYEERFRHCVTGFLSKDSTRVELAVAKAETYAC